MKNYLITYKDDSRTLDGVMRMQKKIGSIFPDYAQEHLAGLFVITTDWDAQRIAEALESVTEDSFFHVFELGHDWNSGSGVVNFIDEVSKRLSASR